MWEEIKKEIVPRAIVLIISAAFCFFMVYYVSP